MAENCGKFENTVAPVAGAVETMANPGLAAIAAEGERARRDGQPLKANPHTDLAMVMLGGMFGLKIWLECWVCGGSGRDDDKRCQTCEGHGKVMSGSVRALWVKMQGLFSSIGINEHFRQRFPEPFAWQLGWQRENGRIVAAENAKRKAPRDPRAGRDISADVGTSLRRQHGEVVVEEVRGEESTGVTARARVRAPTALDAMRPALDARQFWAGRMIQELHQLARSTKSVYEFRVPGRGEVSDVVAACDAMLRGALGAVFDAEPDARAAVVAACCDNAARCDVTALKTGLTAVADHFERLDRAGDEMWSAFLEWQKKLDEEG